MTDGTYNAIVYLRKLGATIRPVYGENCIPTDYHKVTFVGHQPHVFSSEQLRQIAKERGYGQNY